MNNKLKPNGMSAEIVRALSDGPKTNLELQVICLMAGAEVSTYCAQLIRSGRVKRIDGGQGRGTKAVYEKVSL